MKRILLLMCCALLCPTNMLDAAEAATAQPKHRIIKRKTTGKKTGNKKTTKTSTTKSKTPRTQTTTAGKKTTKTPATKKTNTPRTKTTTAGTKTKSAKSKSTKSKATHKNTTGKSVTNTSRAKKTTYGTKPATNRQSVAKKTTAPKATQAKRVYRKGGVTYRHFNHLNNMVPQQLGAINKPVTQNVVLNKPGKGYINANLINFTTPDGKEGQIVLDTHNITAKRAERKGFGASSHGKKSVEVFAGSDATDKGLALIGEYPLTNDNVQIAVDPSGHVTLSGAEKPIEFSIHQ